MNTEISQALSSALVTMLRPLVRILLRNGIAYGSFADLAKKVYVDVAHDEFGVPGKKQTFSRISALTGLTRKETKRLRELNGPEEGSSERYNRSVRVISGWLHDPRFLDARGEPRELPIDGEGPCFSLLVKEYSGDIPTQAMLAVLTAAESVRKLGDRVELVRHAYIPSNDPVDKIRILGTDAAELIATIDHNLTHAPEDSHFQRKVSNRAVQESALPAFAALSREKAQALLEELDDWLAAHEVSTTNGDSSTDGRYVSLGIYYFVQDRKSGEV